MNKNFETYKSTYSALRPSDEATERILHMTKSKTTKKSIKMKPLLAAAACLLLLVVGVFGGRAVSGKLHAVKPSDNLFTITAFAKGNEVSLKDAALVQTDLQVIKVYYIDDENAEYFTTALSGQAFRFDGRNIQTVTFTTQRGDINYETHSDNDVKVTDKKLPLYSEMPYSAALTLEIGKDESVEVSYTPSEAIDRMLRADEKMKDLSVLPKDIITVTVEYRDGATEQATINTSFDKDGNMLLEYKD